jgi:hypothetical protein
MQGDQIASRRPNVLTQEEFNKLEARAKDKEAKRKFDSLSDKDKKAFYIGIYTFYKEANKNLLNHLKSKN